MNPENSYDVVIVGAGIAGAVMALELARAKKSVLVLESGPNPGQQSSSKEFYSSSAKTPESPYPPGPGDEPGREATPRPTVLDSVTENLTDGYVKGTKGSYIYNPKKSYLLQKGPLPFLSTSERVKGGTTRHWLGTSVRMLENDFKMKSRYKVAKDWPLGAEELASDYAAIESEVGVAADVNEQKEHLKSVGIHFSDGYEYPMLPVGKSLVDRAVLDAVDGKSFQGFGDQPVKVTGTPAARNTRAYGNKPQCSGNTNCIPFCPIEAKYDARRTLYTAEKTGHVKVLNQCVVNRVRVADDGRVTGVDYIRWEKKDGEVRRVEVKAAQGKFVVLAAHALETPRLLLMSREAGRGALANGVANSSGMVGKNLMDHPIYLSWALAPKPVWGYRGPLSTAGIETLRDGPFRSERAAWRVEIGNEGWNFPNGDPWNTTKRMITGSNEGNLNHEKKGLFGDALVSRLNHVLTRQWRLAFLMDQPPSESNCVNLDETLTDGLGLPRPVVRYNLSDYTKLGFVFAEIFARHVYRATGSHSFVRNKELVEVRGQEVSNPSYFSMKDEWRSHFENLPAELKAEKITNLSDPSGVPKGFQYFGAGHIMGTCVMGSNPKDSVVDKDLRSWDHRNLFIIGSSVFPTAATANPTMTLGALAYRGARAILKDLATSI